MRQQGSGCQSRAVLAAVKASLLQRPLCTAWEGEARRWPWAGRPALFNDVL